MSPRNQRRRKTVQVGKYVESDETSEEEGDEDSEKLARRGNRVTQRPKVNNNPSSEEEDDIPLSMRKRGRPRHQRGSDSPSHHLIIASHSTEESEEVDTDSPSEKKQKSNSRKLLPKKRKRKARAASAESDRSDSSDAGRKQNIGRAKKRKRRRKQSPEASDGDFVLQTVRSGGKGRVSTGRVRTEVRYNDELEDSELEDLLTVEKDEDDEKVEEVDIDCIEKVLDHREGKVGATGEMTKHFAVMDNGDPNTTLQTSELGTEKGVL